jgi:hypothetical protein
MDSLPITPAQIVRLVCVSATEQGYACLCVLATHGHEIEAGAIVTVEPGRTRIRPPQSG